MKIWLFDIDGTLILAGGAGQEAAFATLTEIFAVVEPKRDQIRFAGRTDRAITRDLFEAHQIAVNEENWIRFRDAYLKHLQNFLVERPGEVLVGVQDAIAQLHECPNSHLGLLTGNLEAGAEAKLRHYELWHYFDFGGYGDHHTSRNDVAEMAFSNAKTHLQRAVAPRDVWVIGDTANDIRCAKAIGANSVAVATGGFSVDELAEEKPDVLLTDLSPSELVEKLLSAHSS
ncbi:MAG: HAD hydrolase-like protein [Planctomycetaceae bacterium]|nr:HAD hydrolase-like protein [Planctomycetaceae bacterium]